MRIQKIFLWVLVFILLGGFSAAVAEPTAQVLLLPSQVKALSDWSYALAI
jgi:hypothetical protein